MTVKELIIKLLNAKLDDKVKLYDIKTDIFYDIEHINILPSAREQGEVYIEYNKDYSND